MSDHAEYGCDIGFDAGYQCGKDESAKRIATLEQQNAELVAALKDWDALIKYNYSGSREAMSAMQQCAFDTDDLLSKVKQP